MTALEKRSVQVEIRSALTALVLAFLFSSHAWGQDAEESGACASPQARQFDFWIGQWEVTAKDAVAGYSTITSILDGCVLLEEYSAANASYSGKSFNYYDEADGKWHQEWVDNGGLRLHLVGGFAGGKMVMSGERVKDGVKMMDRITWSDNADGTVRQLWDASRDGGKTWNTLFDGLYTKM